MHSSVYFTFRTHTCTTGFIAIYLFKRILFVQLQAGSPQMPHFKTIETGVAIAALFDDTPPVEWEPSL